MPPKRRPQISKRSISTNLFSKDQKVIEKEVSEKRFDSPSAAIRYFVQKGIERDRLTNLAYTFEGRVVRRLQTEVVTEALLPLKNQIDEFGKLIQDLKQQQKAATTGVQATFEKAINQLQIAASELQLNSGSRLPAETNFPANLATMIEGIYRNEIMMRGLFYIFLLAYQSGAIKETSRLDLREWQQFVIAANEKVSGLATDYISNFTAQDFETFIRKFAHEIFLEAENLYRKRPKH